MNISLINNFAVRKNQFSNQNYQTKINFKGSETAKSLEERYKYAMTYRGCFNPQEAIKFSHDSTFINFLRDLKVNENDDIQTRAKKEEYTQKIVQEAIKEDVGARRIMNIAFKWHYDGNEPEKAFIALGALATPEEKRELFLKDDVLKLTHTYSAFKSLVEVFKDDKDAIKKLCNPETNLGCFHLNEINQEQRTELSQITPDFS